REIGSENWMIRQTASLSLITFYLGDFQATREQAAEALRLASKSGLAGVARAGVEMAPSMLGMLAALEEDYVQSWELCESAFQLHPNSTVSKECLAVAACGLGNYSTARLYFLDALKEWFVFKSPRGMAFALPVAAILLAHQDQSERAAELLGL